MACYQHLAYFVALFSFGCSLDQLLVAETTPKNLTTLEATNLSPVVNLEEDDELKTGVLDPTEKSTEPSQNDTGRKVQELGLSLKHKVEILQMSDKLDIVFLVDASSSVGDKNFKSELTFVKKLLSGFSISINETRVAVITFSDEDKVVRHIDHISVPLVENHKCSMLHSDLPNIKYLGGLTYTLGALIEAQSILEWSRSGAQKAIFLITDGFSNGGDPTPVAEILKENGTFIFTFGILSGNTEELQRISSTPAAEFSFIVDSFDQFEAVVRRALHQDLSVGSYQVLQESTPCNTLCSELAQGTHNCCDLQAQCSCGTGSGHYRCLCNPGYYGSGLNGSCHSCPNGTYFDGQRPGDKSVCSICPDPNHITIVGQASSIHSCICKRGFVAHGNLCEVINCPVLYPPENGYFVKGAMCPNVFNAACGMRCKAGFTLHGSSIRLCQEDGTWSGKAPKCVVRMCPDPEVPSKGEVKCSLKPPLSNDLLDLDRELSALANQYAVDTECQFTCNPGHILIGSRHRVCLPLARWNGLRTVCKPVLCSPLIKPVHGSIFPETCSETSKLPFGQKCNITCQEGFRLVGPASRKCGGKGGQWSPKSPPNKCIDEQPPIIICPMNVNVTTDQGEAFSTVTIPQPTAFDNSGKTPLVWSIPSVSSPMKIPIGVLLVTYIAMDPSHNQAMCNITITVDDREPPVIETCISPKPIYLQETGDNNSVSWIEPEFHDNSGKKLKITSSHHHGAFPEGRTDVQITATDESGNNITCIIEVIVEGNPCSLEPVQVPHATVTCKTFLDLINCSMTCYEGYEFDVDSFANLSEAFFYDNGSVHFSCPVMKEEGISKNMKTSSLPNCGQTVLPNTISQEGNILFTVSEGACEDPTLLSKVKIAVEQELSQTTADFCSNNSNIVCNILDTNATCEEIVSLEEEETNAINHIQQSLSLFHDTAETFKSYLYKSHFVKRETTSSLPHARLNVHFKMLGRLQVNQSKVIDPLIRNNFSLLKNSVQKTTILLPPSVHGQTVTWKGNSPELTCPVGSIPHMSGSCVRCPRGSFFSTTLRKCLPCAIGEYQQLDGQTYCEKCVEGTSTRFVGSRGTRDCLNLCQPGSFGNVLAMKPSKERAVLPCSLCHPGTYQSNYGATRCIPCPADTHSFKRGAKSMADCFKSNRQNVWSLPTSCLPDLCLNGGTCRLITLGFVSCECRPQYFGSFCELVMDDCSSNPCLNGGYCVSNHSSGYTCNCLPGFGGTNCQDEFDECSSNPCLNNSTCEDLRNGFFCDCSNGFQGLNCGENINDCLNEPCGEHGLCVDDIASYNCTCVDGFSGQHCEIESINPCILGNPCLNGGSCEALNTSMYRCTCVPGWDGKHCDVEEDSCLSSPCLNNGTCLKTVGGNFSCLCAISYVGSTCETYITSNFFIHLPSPSITDYAVVDLTHKNLTEVTVCLWLQSKDGLNYGTAFSYASQNIYNSLTLTDYNGFVLYVNGDRVVTDVSANDGLWHHVCVLWQSRLGIWSIYLDGFLRDHGLSLSTNLTVRGGGKFVLGQEQDSLGGSFSEAESFIGRIYSFHLWDYILDSEKIFQLATDCNETVGEGNRVKWIDFLSNIQGKLKIESSSFCTGCPPPALLWHGNVTVITTDKDTVAYFTCDDGFVLHKSRLKMVKRRCLKQGSWEGMSPSCVRQSCGFPGYLQGGTFIGRSYLYGNIITYQCHNGAHISGNATRVCQGDGKWSGEPPICKGQECPLLNAPENGYILMKKKLNGIQTARISCEKGFYIDGASMLTCMHDGMWDEAIPDCLPNSCPPPPQVQHAINSNSSIKAFVYKDTVHYECEPGFEMISPHSKILYCNKNGEWCPSGSNASLETSLPLPKCTAKSQCHQPDYLFHGTWEIRQGSISGAFLYSSGSIVMASCDPHFNVVGPNMKQCQHNVWRPLTATQCVKITCDTEELPVHIPHSSLYLSGEEVGDIANLTCKDGFQLYVANTNSSLFLVDFPAVHVFTESLKWMCNPDGSWTMEGQNVFGEEMMIACFQKEAENHSAAQNIQCSQPQAPDFGYLLVQNAGTDYTSDTIVEVQCRSGFRLEGPASIKCVSGKWLGSPICKPVTCQPLPKFPNMNVISSTAVGQVMEFGNLVTFSCMSGFQTQGDLSIRCQSNGKWSPMRGKCIAT